MPFPRSQKLDYFYIFVFWGPKFNFLGRSIGLEITRNRKGKLNPKRYMRSSGGQVHSGSTLTKSTMQLCSRLLAWHGWHDFQSVCCFPVQTGRLCHCSPPRPPSAAFTCFCCSDAPNCLPPPPPRASQAPHLPRSPPHGSSVMILLCTIGYPP